MYEACKSGKFPSIETMCQYGLLGLGGTNPLDVFKECKDIVKKGGHPLQVPSVQYFECRLCGFYSFTKRCECEVRDE